MEVLQHAHPPPPSHLLWSRISVSLLASIFDWILRPPDRGSLGAVSLTCSLFRDAVWMVRRFMPITVHQEDDPAWMSRWSECVARLCVVTIPAELLPFFPLAVSVITRGGLLGPAHLSLHHFPRLTTLALIDVLLTLDHLRELAALPRLADLSLRLNGDVDITRDADAALLFEQGFRSLSRLSLRKSKSSSRKPGSWVSFLAGPLPVMPRVVHLEIFLKVPPAYLGSILSKFRNVESLSLGGTFSDLFFSAALSLMTCLTSLHIQRLVNVRGSCFSSIKSKLEYIWLERCVGLAEEALPLLLEPHVASLKSFRMIHCNLAMQKCPQLSMSALRALQIVCSPLGDESFSRFALCEGIRSLDVRSTPLLSSTGLLTLRSTMRLESLLLSGCENVDSEGVVHLLQRGCEETLRVLDLSGTSCDDSILPAVALCSRLHELRLVCCTRMSLDNWNQCGMAEHPCLSVITLTDLGEITGKLSFPPRTEALYMRGALGVAIGTFAHVAERLPCLQNLTIGLQGLHRVGDINWSHWLRRITLSMYEPSHLPPLGRLPLLSFFMLDSAPNVDSPALEEALRNADALIKLMLSGCPSLISTVDLRPLPALRSLQIATDCRIELFLVNDNVTVERCPPLSHAKIFMG